MYDIGHFWFFLFVVAICTALAELRVPKILQGLSDVTASKGNQVEFKVRIRGDPTPQVEW